jgi:RNA polymerase sigma-70 factor (ECF subfamily)
VADLDPEDEFCRLFERTGRSLLAYALLLTGDRQESQDLVQEAFLRAWRDWERVSTLERPQSWLRRVIYNLAVNRWRSLSTRRDHERLVRHEAVSQETGVGHLDVMRALQSLPMKQRQALMLVAIDDLTTAQAAHEMGAKESSVRVWVSRARASMGHLLNLDAAPAAGTSDHDG